MVIVTVPAPHCYSSMLIGQVILTRHKPVEVERGTWKWRPWSLHGAWRAGMEREFQSARMTKAACAWAMGLVFFSKKINVCNKYACASACACVCICLMCVGSAVCTESHRRQRPPTRPLPRNEEIHQTQPTTRTPVYASPPRAPSFRLQMEVPSSHSRLHSGCCLSLLFAAYHATNQTPRTKAPVLIDGPTRGVRNSRCNRPQYKHMERALRTVHLSPKGGAQSDMKEAP